MQGLRKILDLTRLISIVLLCLHFYLACYPAFESWGWTAPVTDRILDPLGATALVDGPWKVRLAALLFLGISLIGVQGKKDEKILVSNILVCLVLGLALYFLSGLLLYLELEAEVLAVSYLLMTGTGYLLVLSGGAQLSRRIKSLADKDIFNALNETFPQEERLLENEYSVNIPGIYRLRDRLRKCWINIINPFRALLIAGTPGSR